MKIPDYFHTMHAQTCFAKSYNGDGSYYCPDCDSNQGSVWLHSDWRPTMFQALCSKCREKYEPETVKPVSDTYYRLEEWSDYYRNPQLRWVTFNVIKTTAKGVWINVRYHKKGKRFILNDARKRYAYPTKKLALESFIARKNRQISILKSQLEYAQSCYDAAKNVVDIDSLKVEMKDGYFTLQ